MRGLQGGGKKKHAQLQKIIRICFIVHIRGSFINYVNLIRRKGGRASCYTPNPETAKIRTATSPDFRPFLLSEIRTHFYATKWPSLRISDTV